MIWLLLALWYLYMGALTAYAVRKGTTFWLTPVALALGWPVLWAYVIGGSLIDEWQGWRKSG